MQEAPSPTPSTAVNLTHNHSVLGGPKVVFLLFIDNTSPRLHPNFEVLLCIPGLELTV